MKGEGLKILRICEHCNKEFVVRFEFGIATMQNCPHCHNRNDLWIKILLEGKLIVDEAELRKLGTNLKHNLLMKTKWNSIGNIAEELEINVRPNLKICVDIVEIQQIVGDAIDDFLEDYEKEFLGER